MNIDNKNNPTADLQEINKFSKMASEWWDPNGKFAPLHKFNPIRQEYLVDKIKNHFGILPNGSYPFKNLKLLDVGCGGGLIAEPMTRLGAKVTGIDASEKNIIPFFFNSLEQDLINKSTSATCSIISKHKITSNSSFKFSGVVAK